MKKWGLLPISALFAVAATGQAVKAGRHATHRTYYVDALRGSDRHNGRTPRHAFATLTRVNSLHRVAAGSTVAFHAGQEWFGTLSVPQPRMSFVAYGKGAKPILSAAIRVTGWKQDGNVWSRAQTTNPYLINFQGQPGKPVASAAGVNQLNTYYWDGATTLYVYSVTDPTNKVEIPSSFTAVDLNGQPKVTVNGLTIQGAQSNAFTGNSKVFPTGLTVKNSVIRSSYINGIFLNGPACGDTACAAGNVTLSRNEMYGFGGSPIAAINAGATSLTVTDNTVHDYAMIYQKDPITYPNGYLTYDLIYADGIKWYSIDRRGGRGTYVARNTVYNGGLGHADVNYGGGIHPDTVTGGIIECNSIRDTNADGIQLEKTDGGTTARYNFMMKAGTRQYASGIFVRAGDYAFSDRGWSDGVVVAYNTVRGSYWGGHVQVDSTGGTVYVRDLTWRSNILRDSVAETFYVDPGYDDASNAYTGNFLGPAAKNFVNQAGTFRSTCAELIGPLANTSCSDPLFVTSTDARLSPASPARSAGAFSTTRLGGPANRLRPKEPVALSCVR